MVKWIIKIWILISVFGISDLFYVQNIEKYENNKTAIEDNKESKYFIDLDLLDKIEKEIITSNKTIENILMEYFDEDIFSAIYYGDIDGDFYIEPYFELPEDYEFRDRDFFTVAIKDDLYISETYKDFASGRELYTISKAIKKDGEIIGVLGFDLYNLEAK